MRVGMGGQLFSDLVGKDRDLLDEAGEGGHQGASDVHVGNGATAVKTGNNCKIT